MVADRGWAEFWGFSSLKNSIIWNKQGEDEEPRPGLRQEREFVSHSSCSSKLQQG